MVLLLHAKREQEEPEGVIERGTGPLGVGTQGSFLVGPPIPPHEISKAIGAAVV